MVATPYQTTRSHDLFTHAKTLMPGGVNSPVRAFKSVGAEPVFIARASGAYLWDEDGNRYIDYIGTWGPAIVGHAHPEVQAALVAAIPNGTSFGAPSRLENVLAEMVIEAVPSIEMVRFVNSGTEATMSAVRLARAYTSREKLLKFSGCYHGHGDLFLVQAGSGVATLGLPDSPGVPQAVTSQTLTVPYNDLPALEAMFTQYPDSIAGVILEPVVGNAGCIPPLPGFLEGVRALTNKYGALLIFDEVMTGFRLAYGGAQERFGIDPDLTCLGKIIGGGLPVGAYGGKREIMEMVAPAGPMYQAGTLSGNPLAMTAGIKTLELLQRPGTYTYLEDITTSLSQGLLKAAQETGHTACGNQVGAMTTLFFCAGPVTSYERAKASDREKFGRFHRGMMRAGIYLAPSQFEAGFLSLAHTQADIDETIRAARHVLAQIPAAGME
ncbi:glutamate-1-semialdehyde 2,1-aminomutase [Anthocerotibacter panamensis]|uniref:glutamate-1-semialdehyde 2,1-aminomutase n=1 Tax=Anthocerotibacter panamensis TaxID=2857077 RepID=UPI0036F20FF5